MALEYAKGCGFTHAGWTPAGFSGDELPSDRYPTRQAHGTPASRHQGRRHPPVAPGHLVARGSALAAARRASSRASRRRACASRASRTTSDGCARRIFFSGAGAFTTAAGSRPQDALFESVVQPLVFRLGLAAWLEPAFDATEIFMVGALEVVVLAVVLGALEKWRPIEVWADRRAVRVDVIYTLLVRLGVLPLAIFFLLLPLVSGLDGWLRMHGFIPPEARGRLPGALRAPARLLPRLPRRHRLRDVLAAPRAASRSASGGRCTRCTTASAR